MKLSEAVKPISYLRVHTSELIHDVVKGRRTLVITEHGEAKVVVQDLRVYEDTMESLAMLKLLAQSSKSIKEGRVSPLKEAFSRIRKHARQ